MTEFHADHAGPDLLDMLDAAVETATKVAPRLFDGAHPAGDLVHQQGGHFVMDSLATRDGTKRCRVWAFLDLGSVLSVLTCSIHGNTIDPARARALADALHAWADRKDPRP